jgi:hypothetical protein
MAKNEKEKKSTKDVNKPVAAAPPKKSIKDVIGPVAVTPSIRKQSSIDGTAKLDDEGSGLQIDTKFGTFNITKSKNIQSFAGDPNKYTSKQKGVSYDKEFKVGDSSRINLSANVGKTKDPMGKKGTTKGGVLSFTKEFNKGGLTRGAGKAIRGTKFKGIF